jgi:hypothetical protein
MPVPIVDDDQRSDRRATPMRLGRCADPDPFGFRLCGGICGVGAPRQCAPTLPASRRLASAPAKPESKGVWVRAAAQPHGCCTAIAVLLAVNDVHRYRILLAP